MQNIILNVFKSLSYPPTEDQLNIIGYFFNNLWLLRILSLLLLILALFFWCKTILRLTNKTISLVSAFIIILTPTFYVLWLSSPVDCLKIVLVMFLVFILSNRNILLLLSGSVLIILFSLLTTTERSSFYHKLGLRDAKIEVQERFAAEDSLTNPIKVPLKVKRVVYNKYYFAYKELINEVIPFFDMESLFFQEIHPLEQKSVVIFVWPELLLFIGGGYLLIKHKNRKVNSLIIISLFLALVNFLFDPFMVFKKFELIIFPVGTIMAWSVLEISKTKIWTGRVVGGIIVLLSFYGITANLVDINKRPDYWLDNRPYFYEFVFSSIKKKDLNNFNKIYVTSMVGNTRKYCSYYLGDCDDNKFVFNSFELKDIRPEKNTIYAGFSGEFIGSDFKNKITNDWLDLIKDKGFTNLETIKLRDTIAYKFGNDVVIGEAK